MENELQEQDVDYSFEKKQDTFSFQKRFLYLEIILHTFAGTIFIVSWFPTIVSLISLNMIIPSAIRTAVYLNGTAFSLLFLFSLLKKDLSKHLIVICDNKLTFKKPYKISTVNFGDIKKIKLISIPFIRGYLKLYTEHSSLTVPLLVERPEKLLLSILESLDNCGQADIPDKKSVEKLTKKLSAFETAYSRSANAFAILSRSNLYMLFINIFIAKEIWQIALIPMLLWAISGMFFPPVIYAFTEWKNSILSHKKRFSFGMNEYILSSIIFFPVYLAWGIFFRSFFE